MNTIHCPMIKVKWALYIPTEKYVCDNDSQMIHLYMYIEWTIYSVVITKFYSHSFLQKFREIIPFRNTYTYTYIVLCVYSKYISKLFSRNIFEGGVKIPFFHIVPFPV